MGISRRAAMSSCRIFSPRTELSPTSAVHYCGFITIILWDGLRLVSCLFIVDGMGVGSEFHGSEGEGGGDGKIW